MPSNDLVSYMRDATHIMQSEYARIRKRAAEDPGTAGDNGEENWAELLRKWLPHGYRVVTKGRVMNQSGQCGPQVDILVLSPAYPEALLTKKEYLEGGVVAAFECKLTLKAGHIRSAVENAAAIRRLSSYQRRGTPYTELHPPVLFGLLAHSHAWQGENANPIANIARHLQEQSWKAAEHPNQMVDFVCVSDLANWNSQKFIELNLGGRPRHVPEEMWNTWERAGGVVQANLLCYSNRDYAIEVRDEVFTPIGFFVTDLYEKLSWNDERLRPLAAYFTGIGLPGINSTVAGQAAARMWPITVLSPRLVETLRHGSYPASTERWHEWRLDY
jgi:hypothetical protein